MKKIIDLIKNRNVSAIGGMIIGTLIYCISIVFILDLGEFYAGGITGISQLINTIVVDATGKEVIGLKSIIIALLNAPLFIIGWRGVSKRFAILSLVSVGLQMGIIALFEYLRLEVGFNPFSSLGDDLLTLSILGGLLLGVGCGVGLRSGSSTGGMDILSQFISLKKNVSFAKFSLSIDISIVIVAGIIGNIEVAVYTVIRMIISILVLDKIHTIYKYMKVTIVTDEKDKMREALIKRFNHGITIYSAVGGYSLKPRYVLEIVVSSYEANVYRNIAKEIDPKSFITYTAIKRIYGFFNRNVIA